MGGSGSGSWGNYRRRVQVEECLALDCRDLRELGLLASPGPVAGQLGWLYEWATLWLGPLEANSRELRLRLSEDLDPSRHLQTFKLDRVEVGAAPRWLLTCRLCGKQRARVLYLPPRSTKVGCKRCHALMYRSVQQHDHRLDRIVQRLRVGDVSAIEELSTRGRKPGYTGFVADRLFLAAVAKAFPDATSSLS